MKMDPTTTSALIDQSSSSTNTLPLPLPLKDNNSMTKESEGISAAIETDKASASASAAAPQDAESNLKRAEDYPLSDDKLPADTATATASASASAAPQNDGPPLKLSTLSTRTLLTYQSSKTSSHYQRAKSHLNDGNFEECLTVIAEEMQRLEVLTNGDEFHECLAPFQYLYGTTLLYEVEESDAMMVGGAGAGAAGAGGQEVDEDGGGVPEEQAEDLQIAWENLESARSILVKLCCKSFDQNSTKELQLDLAQIHHRLGDLQKANGNYADAIHDYRDCLRLRTQYQVTPVSPYHRTIADVQYCIGTACLLLAAEGEGSPNTAEVADGLDLNSGGDEQDLGLKATMMACASAAKKLTNEEIESWRRTSCEMYLDCGRTLGGLICQLCGVDRMYDSARRNSATHANANADADTNADADADDNAADGATHSTKLSNIRSSIALLHPKTTSTKDVNTVSDLKELLDEIQETLDASTESIRVLQDVTLLKKEAEAMAEQEDRKPAAVGVTTVGFGSASAEGTTTVGFGAAAASADSKPAAQAIAQKPMMVVRKKKRPSSDTGTTNNTNTKGLVSQLKMQHEQTTNNGTNTNISDSKPTSAPIEPTEPDAKKQKL